MNRRTFLQQMSLALAVGLAGCGQTNNSVTTFPTQGQGINASTLFPGLPDMPDLTAVGEQPPTEIPQPERFFGPDPQDLPVPNVRARTLSDVFEYVVVVMLENRSFDHFAGYLYPGSVSSSGQKFNGAGGRTFINKAPDGTSIYFSQAQSLQVPLIDPSEEYQSVNLALFNQFNPPSNQFAKKESEYAAPYNLPNGGAFFPPPLSGFVTMFDWTLRNAKKPTTLENLQTIMQGFTPNLIPVWSQLAQQYAICDNWFCGVPSQTYCNRSMFNAASSSGHVNNPPIYKWPFDNKVPTIWDRLSEANVSWKIYYDAFDIVCGTKFINYPSLKKYSSSEFRYMYHFYDDVKAGNLPKYSWVQPRLVVDQNSYHPDAGAPGVKRGEILLNDIYQAIRQSNNPNGSNYLNTLLIVTFDEAGTCFDHVPPPSAVPPGDGFPGQLGFGFDRHGQRIPTLLISPWFSPGTVISDQFDATSVIRTLEVKYGLKNLTARDAASPILSSIQVNDTPRSRSAMPRLQVRKLTAEESASTGPQPLGETGEGIVGMAYALLSGSLDGGLPPGVQTVSEAVNWLQANNAQNL